MKLTTIMLFIAVLQVNASAYAQKITLSEKNSPLAKVFEKISTQSGIDFIFTKSALSKAVPVTLDVTNADVKNVLEIIFNSQPLNYELKDKFVLVTAKEKPISDKILEVRNVNVHGYVYDEKGLAVAGVTVMIKGTQAGTVTNEKGEFDLRNVAENITLIFSAINIESLETELRGRTSLVITVKAKNNNLKEVVINKGYYSTTQKLNTGDVTKITAQDIAKQPVNNLLLALQGRVPGLFIQQTSGLPGADVSVTLRGLNSISAANGNIITNTPLYIIDGVAYPGADINKQASGSVSGSSVFLFGPNGNGSPLSYINPADIESIEILKDADATAIYGSRAANGVILITTKQGRPGKGTFDANIRTGAGWLPSQVKVLNTQQYRALRKLGFANDKIIPTIDNAESLLVYDSTKNTNFQDLLLGHAATYTDVQGSFTGGTRNTSFLLSGNYRSEKTFYIDRRANNNGGAHLAVNHNSDNNKFQANTTVTYNISTINLPAGNFVSAALALPPNVSLTDAAGNIAPNNGFFANPLRTLNATYNSTSRNLIGGLDLRYTLLKGLNIKTRVGYNRIDYTQNALNPSTSLDVLSGVLPNAISTNSNTQNVVVEPQADYTAVISKGILTVLIGGTYQSTTFEQPYYINATDFPSDTYLNNIYFAGSKTIVTGFNQYKYASVFSRLNYNWDDKYILNGVFRRDGSSKFGKNKQFGDFGAIGAAWLFSNEAFIKNSIRWLSTGKLRGSYGIVGNDNIGNYGYLSTYQGGSNYGTAAGLSPARIANPDFSFEINKKLEAGIDLGFLNDRILFTAAAYRNRTGNQLVFQPLASQVGFSSYQANLPATVQNTGVEFTLNTVNIQKENFRWSTSLNVSFNRNKLIAFPGLATSSYAFNYEVGKPLNGYYRYEYTGPDPKTGIPAVKDQNGDGVITNGLASTGTGDRIYAGKSDPDYFGGLSNTIQYKRWQLDMFFQFAQGFKTIVTTTSVPGGYSNIPVYILDEINALTPGRVSPFIGSGTSNSNQDYVNYRLSNAGSIKDGSYIRLGNASLSYRFAEKYLKAAHLSSGSVFVQGQNIFVISRFKGPDPETGVESVPPLRRIVFGLQFSL